MKTMCPPGYHHNGFVANHALGHMTVAVVFSDIVTTSIGSIFQYFESVLFLHTK